MGKLHSTPLSYFPFYFYPLNYENAYFALLNYESRNTLALLNYESAHLPPKLLLV